jgi:hypothetical protein
MQAALATSVASLTTVQRAQREQLAVKITVLSQETVSEPGPQGNADDFIIVTAKVNQVLKAPDNFNANADLTFRSPATLSPSLQREFALPSFSPSEELVMVLQPSLVAGQPCMNCTPWAITSLTYPKFPITLNADGEPTYFDPVLKAPVPVSTLAHELALHPTANKVVPTASPPAAAALIKPKPSATKEEPAPLINVDHRGTDFKLGIIVLLCMGFAVFLRWLLKKKRK